MIHDITFEKGLPADEEAERLVLGCMMLGHLDVGIARGMLDGSDFALESHRRIFDAMEAVYTRGASVDRLTVHDELRRRGQAEAIGGRSYLVTLDNDLPAVSNIESYVRIVKDKATLRRTAALANNLYNRCLNARDEPGDVLADAARFIRELGEQQRAKSKGLRGFAEIIADFGGLNSYAQNHDAGIQTPWPRINAIIGGFRPGQMITVAGLTGSGKSAFGLQVAQHAAQQGHGAAVFSLEMSEQELFERLACGNAGIDSKKLERNRLTDSERIAFQRAAAELANLSLWIDDSTSCTLPAIHAALRKHICSHAVKLLVIDYLQLMQSVGGRENRTQQISEISRGMKLIAREYKIPVIVLAQFNRGPAVERREPQLHDLKESGSIEQDSDKVLFLHPMEAAGTPQDAPTNVRLIVAKQRNGKKHRWVEMLFHDQYCRFNEVTRADT